MSVTLVKAERKDLPSVVDATGTVAPRRSVEVRAQVPGLVRDVLVREGDSVRQGQVLFKLDDRNEVAQLDRAKAQLLKDEAALADAQRQLVRARELMRQNFVSQGAVDAAATAEQTQAAAVAASRAAVRAAEVSLSLMVITASQPGKLGAITVHPGAYVSPAALPLVTISDMQSVLVVFSVPQRHLPDALRAQRGKLPAVDVASADASPSASKPQTAMVVFVDNNVDATTGTIRLKAELDNRDGLWWPGGYVRVKLRLQTLKDATVVPVAAIVQGARGRSVFIIDDEGQAQSKPVEVLDSADGLAAVKGISPGDKVVLDGRQNLRNGTKVVERKAAGGNAR